MASRARTGLYNLYKGTDDAKALDHLENYVELEKVIHDEKSTELLQSFSVKYDVLKKEQSIALQKEQIKWKNVMLSVLAVLLALISLLFYLSRKTIKVTREKNSILAKANLDKDRLLAIAQSNIPKEVKDEILSIADSAVEVPNVKMTRREQEIANLCAKGLLNKEIAEKLNISQRTVEVHKNNIFKKLGINNTVELVRYMQIIMREESK
jgi:DNA-binding CsgD family transcriptional regulator